MVGIFTTRATNYSRTIKPEQITLPFKISRLPDEDSTHIIVKLKYEAEAHQVPDIQELLAKFKAPVNLYQSQVDIIQGHIIGSLLVGILT